MAEVVNLESPIQRGDTLAFEFRWDDGGDPPEPVDMRGKELILTFKLSNLMPDEDATVTVSVTPDDDDADAENGRVVIVVPPQESAKLIAGAKYHYGLRSRVVVEGETVEITYLRGTVPVEDA